MTRKILLIPRSAFGGMTANERRLGRFLRDGSGHPDPAPAAPAPTDGDPFAAAFDAAALDEGGAGDPNPEPPAGETPPAPAPETPPAAEAPSAPDGTTPPAGETPPATPAAETPPASVAPPATDAKPQLSAEDVLNRLAGLVEQKPQAEAPPAAQAQPETPIYSQDEMAILTEYEKNWPDVAKAEALVRKAEYHDLLKYVFTEVVGLVKPLQDQLGAIGNNLHIGELKQMVPDYSDNLEQEVHSWIDTQPAYLQSAYKQVMKGGTSEEVADLFGRYRAATGAAPAAPQVQAPATPSAAAPAPPLAPGKTELSSAAKQAAESLAPVSGERSQVPQGEDPQDFDSAFKKYAASM